MFSVNYQKRKNTQLFAKIAERSHLGIKELQNYIPIYNRFFSLNETNYNSINLNHDRYIADIIDVTTTNNEITGHKFKIKSISNDAFAEKTDKVHIKVAPLLNPFKYALNKYNMSDLKGFKLPTNNINQATELSQIKANDPNNSAYTDGFFTFLTSKLMHSFNFVHGVDYYGGFLGIKQGFKVDILEDIEYLLESPSFRENIKNKVIEVDNYEMYIQDVKPKLKPLNIHNDSAKSKLSVKSFSNEPYNELFESNPVSGSVVHLEDIKDMTIVDITNMISPLSLEEQEQTNKSISQSSSGSTCSSRTSITNSDDEDLINEIEGSLSETGSVLEEQKDDNNSITNVSCDDFEDIESDEEEYDGDEKLFMTIPEFPVQLICSEACENTLDYLLERTTEFSDLTETTTKERWLSMMMQVIMTLLTYQKVFHFTHNDLHTNNIMYIETPQKAIYYIYGKKVFRVPTYGKIYKLIDFGRAIYTVQGKLICSDSFQNGEDASNQYNSEPYFNENKPRLDPNYSFDLCRLGCAIFDYLIDDMDSLQEAREKSNIVRIISDWCMDDNDKNMLYKSNGLERYPDFKLYKMIAKSVHKHTPEEQLKRPEFAKYGLTKAGQVYSKSDIPRDALVVNIDNIPCLA